MVIFRPANNDGRQAKSFETDCFQDGACITEFTQDEGYMADDECEPHVPSRPSLSLEVRRPANTLPLHQPKPISRVKLLSLDRMPSYHVSVKSTEDQTRDTNKSCAVCCHFKNMLKMYVRKEYQGQLSWKVRDAKEKEHVGDDTITSGQVHTAWQAHIINGHVGRGLNSHAESED